MRIRITDLRKRLRQWTIVLVPSRIEPATNRAGMHFRPDPGVVTDRDEMSSRLPRSHFCDSRPGTTHGTLATAAMDRCEAATQIAPNPHQSGQLFEPIRKPFHTADDYYSVNRCKSPN